MAKFDKDELRRLAPAERIRKLRELEEERKKEIEEAEKLIRESVEDLRREKATEDVEIPEAEEVNIEDLFGGEKLEDTVAKEAPADEDAIKYQTNIDYDYLRHVDTGNIQNYNMEHIEQIRERLADIDYKALSADVAKQVVGTRKVLYELKKSLGME